jgi:hypothetical protein
MAVITRKAPTASGKPRANSGGRGGARGAKVAGPGVARGVTGRAGARAAPDGEDSLVSSPGSSISGSTGGADSTVTSPSALVRAAAAARGTTVITLPGAQSRGPARLVPPETPGADRDALSVVVDDSVMCPSDMWYACARSGQQADLQRKIDLQDFVRHDLFSGWKFFTDKRQLIFDTSSTAICYHICTAMNVKRDYWALWWEHNKDELVSTLNRKRTDVTAVVKRVFIGTYGE